MAKTISVGIDIGTYQIKVMVAECLHSGDGLPKVIGAGFSESKGLRHGYILNRSDVIRSIRLAVSQAEKATGVRIKRAYLSIGGIGLSAVTTSAATVITRADAEITDLDVEKAIDASREAIPQAQSVNRKIIHTIPIQYKIDGKVVLGKPYGMRGSKLEVKTLFVSCLEHHLNDLVETVEEAGISVEDIVASPIAASVITLSKTQKIAGCVLANIGSETVSIVVYENNTPISLEVFPIGSNDITNDIALGLKIPLEEAEEVKRGAIIGANYPKKKLEEIIAARLSDIFELIEAHLKKLGRSGLLPAGIIITGGGAAIDVIEDFARVFLKLPSRIAQIHLAEKMKSPIKDASWSVAYGLAVIGCAGGDGEGTGRRFVKKAKHTFLSWIRQFLP